MVDDTTRGADADLSKFGDDIASIKARIFWLLVPTFFMLLAVLGLSILTWIEVNAIKGEIDSVEKSIENLHKPRPRHAAEEKKEGAAVSPKNIEPLAQGTELDREAQGREGSPTRTLAAHDRRAVC